MTPLMLFVPGVPIPQGSHMTMISRSTGKPFIVDSNVKLAQWRNAIASAAIEMQPEWEATKQVVFPLGQPIAVRLTFIMPRPAGHYGTGRNAEKIKDSAPRFPAKMPDIDKLMRAILDALTVAQVWHDDGQVVSVNADKVYTHPTLNPTPGVTISIWEVP